MSTSRDRYPWPETMPAAQRPALSASPPKPRRRRSDPPADPDELSAGNAGFEWTQDPATPQERAEYQRGWRTGMGSGLVGGILLGVLGALSALWLGLQAGLRAL
jgi:hypothetical protein